MGFFGTYLYDGQQRHWRPATLAIDEVGRPIRGDQQPAAAEPWLLVDIHDSDFTTVIYRPAGRGTGVAYLGITPRTYFEDERASAPTDVTREGAGLADWWRLAHDRIDDPAGNAKEIELRSFLAPDLEPDDIDTEDEGEAEDDAELFVEVKTRHFLTALDLPLPAELRT
jgi:hypothetical protein